jgi:hypothetical protein
MDESQPSDVIVNEGLFEKHLAGRAYRAEKLKDPWTADSLDTGLDSRVCGAGESRVRQR